MKALRCLCVFFSYIFFIYCTRECNHIKWTSVNEIIRHKFGYWRRFGLNEISKWTEVTTISNGYISWFQILIAYSSDHTPYFEIILHSINVCLDSLLHANVARCNFQRKLISHTIRFNIFICSRFKINEL